MFAGPKSKPIKMSPIASDMMNLFDEVRNDLWVMNKYMMMIFIMVATTENNPKIMMK